MNRSQPSPVTFEKKDVEIIARETQVFRLENDDFRPDMDSDGY